MFEAIVEKISSGKISEVTELNTELKAEWHQDAGKRIAAVANELNDSKVGFLVIGVSDKGRLLHTEATWLKATEQQTASHIRQYLSPTHAIKLQGHTTPDSYQVLLIRIESPGDITTWNHKAYKRVGTQTEEMTPDERLELSLRLPGQDYSKHFCHGSPSGSLIVQFAQKLVAKDHPGLPKNLGSIATGEILKRLRCESKMVTRILFGDLTVRVAYYDASGDVVAQVSKQGAFSILADDFVAEIQRWTRGKGTVLHKDSIAVSPEDPYPIKALRESLANAVAHAFYERDDGEIIVDLHPDRIVIRNNCVQDVKTFAQEWFSKKSWSRNKFLMQLLREAGFTDELGTGKTRLYSQMLEAGKREPLIEYYEKGTYACWQITLYNEENNQSYVGLFKRFKNELGSIEEARLATALTLWRYLKWSEIQKKLDEHYRSLARFVIHNPNSPVIIIGDEVLTKRWVNSALAGKNSTAFSAYEEALIKKLLHTISYIGDRNGRLNTKEAKRFIGLSSTPSESTQLSNLFRKWRSEGVLIGERKRGEWRFPNPPAENIEVIASAQNNDTETSKQPEAKQKGPSQS